MKEKPALKDFDINELKKRGLSESEANQFYDLLGKVKLSKKDVSSFDKEMGNGIPFEGGMGFAEALTGMKIAAKQS